MPSHLDDATLTHYGLIYGCGGLILYMLFIVWRLARDSNAGRYGTAVLFLVLSTGIFGFIVKEAMVWRFQQQLAVQHAPDGGHAPSGQQTA